MRRPPSNLDDFLQGGGEDPGPGKAPESRVDEVPATGDAERRVEAPKKAAPRAKSSRSRPKKAGTGKAPAAKAPAVMATSGETAPRPRATTSRTAAAPSPSEPTAGSDRPRGRTVSGEAAPTVIMSVRVPLELRERLEDILAAYSGVTFSDLVIRGLENMVGEVEERHRERTGEDLPRRESRPELLL